MEKGQGKIRKLGLTITEALKRTSEEDQNDKAIKGHILAGTPASWNWRNANGKNYTTPIQDQGDCGSCVAFGSTAALEVIKQVADQGPGEDDKLSEADLFSNGGSCSGGWTIEAANSALQSKGVCPEKCWPYNGSKQSCCDGNKLKILSATRITSDAVAKQWLSSNGAIQAAMDVNSDFFDYSGGVYSPQYGDYVGGHCICVIGYDDVDGCWICKNSWGTEWGDMNDPGWFKIAYGECGIFRAYAGYGYAVSGSPGPNPNPNPTPAPTGDIVLPEDGILAVMSTQHTAGVDLVIGAVDRALSTFKKSYSYYSLGDFSAGGYNVALKYQGQIVTDRIVKTSGQAGLWMVWTKLPGARAYNYYFQFKFIPGTQAIADQSIAIGNFLGIETTEEDPE